MNYSQEYVLWQSYKKWRMQTRAVLMENKNKGWLAWSQEEEIRGISFSCMTGHEHNQCLSWTLIIHSLSLKVQQGIAFTWSLIIWVMIWNPLTVSFMAQMVMVKWVCLNGVHFFQCREQTKWHLQIPSFAHLCPKSSRMTYSRRVAVLSSSKTLCIMNSGVVRGTTECSPLTDI